MAYPANTCRAVFQFGLPNGTNGYVTPHFRKSDGGDYTQLELAGLCDLLEDWWENSDFEGETNGPMKGAISDDCTLQSITCTGLAAAVPPQASVAVGTTGTNTGSPLPNESALVVTLYTGLVGRSYRGRNFWPGIPVSAMEANGTLNGSYVSDVQDTFDALIAGIENASGSELAVNSETLGLSTFVTSCVVRDVVHHQRRRNS